MAESMLLDVAPPETTTASSFTALLGLPSNQAMELLHHEPESGVSPVIPAIEICQRNLSNYSPSVFISNTDLIERASMFSIFSSTGAVDHQDMSNSSEDSLKLKKEEDLIITNADSQPTSSIPNEQKQSLTKRKEREKKIKGASAAKKSKKMENQMTLKACDQKMSKDDHGEKLPYVHVRARRGQATDSHSLAERARREKINARMKLLQEIVPGCAKISGMALVLDETINHVQSLQRQVEFLSMRLAAVNPRINFNLEGLLAAESGGLTPSIYPSTVTHEPSMWPEVQVNNIVEGQQFHDQNHTQQLHSQHGQHQLWHLDVLQQPVWGRDNNENFVTSPENSVFSYSSANSVALPPNQLKMKI